VPPSVPFIPVTLRGWRRVVLHDGHYPTLQRARATVEGVLALRLEVVEEGKDKIAVEIGDRQCAGFELRVLGGEQDQ
jgi:hypothetical protein